MSIVRLVIHRWRFNGILKHQETTVYTMRRNYGLHNEKEVLLALLVWKMEAQILLASLIVFLSVYKLDSLRYCPNFLSSPSTPAATPSPMFVLRCRTSPAPLKTPVASFSSSSSLSCPFMIMMTQRSHIVLIVSLSHLIIQRMASSQN